MAEHRKGVAHRDVWVTLGLGVSAAAAATSSFSGLRSLAIVTGWPTPLAALLPLTVDAFAMTATRVWLAASTGSGRARRFARWNAICAILLSVAGNATWHLIAAHLLVVSWGIVLAVGSIPALVLGLVAHLAVLRSQVDAFEDDGRTEFEHVRLEPVPVPVAVPRPPAVRTSQPAVRTQDESRYASEDELQAAARMADQAHRVRTGRAISRDELRRQLGISGARATELARWLKQEREATMADSA